jgi:hypothetical protein
VASKKGRTPRAGRRKCKRCRNVWTRKKGERSVLCGRCETHCSRCDDELVIGKNFLQSNDKARQFYCSKCTTEIRKFMWHTSDSRREKSRDNQLVSKYGITAPEYDAMLKAQGGMCWICQQPPKEGGRRLSVDHLHSVGENKRNPREKRGRVRGLLCWGCNSALGKFRDDITKLRRAADYLECWPGQKILNKEEADG